MHFRHISAKIQPKNLKQNFDWEEGAGGPPWLRPWSSPSWWTKGNTFTVSTLVIEIGIKV